MSRADPPSPGASGPGDPGYGGRATVGDVGAVGTAESYVDAASQSEEGVEGRGTGPTEETRKEVAMVEKEKDRDHEGTDGVESNEASAPENASPEDYKNIPGNQT